MWSTRRTWRRACRRANRRRSPWPTACSAFPSASSRRSRTRRPGYVIVGGGKTALDAICWLLDRGTPADDITWIRPRDSWLLNRKFFQPGDCVMETFEGIVLEIEAVARVRVGRGGLRTARGTRGRAARRSVGGPDDDEGRHAQHRRARAPPAGRARRASRPRRAHRPRRDRARTRHRSDESRTSARALRDARAERPSARADLHRRHDHAPGACRGSACACRRRCIGFVEASGRTTAEKNRLCRPNPWPQTPFDFLRAILLGIRTELAWQDR